MGLGPFGHSSSSYDMPMATALPNPNPNPRNFELIFAQHVGNYLIVKIRYPDCRNYEGMKVMVYEGISTDDLIKQGSIDPHFSDNKNFHSPIARFVPSHGGMIMARAFVNAMLTGKF